MNFFQKVAFYWRWRQGEKRIISPKMMYLAKLGKASPILSAVHEMQRAGKKSIIIDVDLGLTLEQEYRYNLLDNRPWWAEMMDA